MPSHHFPEHLFEKLPMGLLLLHNDPPRVVKSNPHFHCIARGKESLITDTVLKDLRYFETADGAAPHNYFRCDVNIDNSFVVGYSIYKMSETEYLVFLNDISYKKIYIENKGDNRFYDRLSGLLAEVVHEIGNPLTALTTTLQVLQEYMGDWDLEKQKAYVGRAIDEIDRLSGYLDRMRSFSRIDVPYQQSVLLAPIVSHVINRNNELIKQKKLDVSYRLDDSQKVLVDEDLFYQVLLNLFLNSVDILPESGKISIEVEEINEFFVKLVFRNNGPPVPDEIKEKVFLPFFTTKSHGSGIGLAVSLKLMIRMGGSMKLEKPEKGWGVKFVIYVPVSVEEICEKIVNSKPL
jgi:signal transduction histidine kinase